MTSDYWWGSQLIPLACDVGLFWVCQMIFPWIPKRTDCTWAAFCCLGGGQKTGSLLILCKGTKTICSCTALLVLGSQTSLLHLSCLPISSLLFLLLFSCCFLNVLSWKKQSGMCLYYLVLSLFHTHFNLLICLPYFAVSSLKKVQGLHLSVCLQYLVLHLVCM